MSLNNSSRINLNLNSIGVQNRYVQEQINSEYYDVNVKAAKSNKISHRTSKQDLKFLKNALEQNAQDKSGLNMLPSLPANKKSQEMAEKKSALSRKGSQDPTNIGGLQDLLLQSSRLSVQNISNDYQKASPNKNRNENRQNWDNPLCTRRKGISQNHNSVRRQPSP